MPHFATEFHIELGKRRSAEPVAEGISGGEVAKNVPVIEALYTGGSKNPQFSARVTGVTSVRASGPDGEDGPIPVPIRRASTARRSQE